MSANESGNQQNEIIIAKNKNAENYKSAFRKNPFLL